MTRKASLARNIARHQEKIPSQSKSGRGCPNLVGGRPAKSVAGNGRVGSNPTPRANKNFKSGRPPNMF